MDRVEGGLKEQGGLLASELGSEVDAPIEADALAEGGGVATVLIEPDGGSERLGVVVANPITVGGSGEGASGSLGLKSPNPVDAAREGDELSAEPSRERL